jgi:MoaA/NifB/PqqE/SkfB family radical SAM enzyme
MGLKQKAQRLALLQAFERISDDPERNLPKALDLLDKIGWAGNGGFATHRRVFNEVVNSPDNNWHQLLMSLWRDIDRDVLRSVFSNFAINASLLGYPRQEELAKAHGCNIPYTMLIDPTSACNLSCVGCWASEYGGGLNLPYALLDNIITQGKELGIYFYLYSGGEPLVRKADLIRLCETHSDCQFAAFTNGTLINEAFADDLLRVKNFIPIISVEGFAEATDARRGAGTFAKTVQAMALLKAKRLPFGISSCYTSANVEVIGSEAYFDQMVAWGAKFCWLFTYMPVGTDAVPELMVSAQQRAFMYQQVRAFRQTKPLFTLDFWNDGEYTKGCVAAGRSYLHINANGDIEPCAFIHYSDSNIREKTLLEALKAPLFMAYRKHQPFNCNHLRPCPLLDNPDALAQMVGHSGAASTDLQSPEDVNDFTCKCRPAAKQWAAVADGIWESAAMKKGA